MLQAYDEPHKFRPERYMENPHFTDPRELSFGFGRRSGLFWVCITLFPTRLNEFNQGLSWEALCRGEHVERGCQYNCVVRHTSHGGRKRDGYYPSV